MDYLIAFGVAFGFSFLGMLPPGMLTMKLIDVSFKRSMQAAIMFGLGAAFVEFFQSLVAIRFSAVIARYLEGNPIVQWSAVALLVVLGLGSLFAKPKKKEISETAQEKSHSSFFNGVAIALLNIIVYVFWMALGAKFMQDGILRNEWPILLVFSFGVMLGSFTVYGIYAKLGVFILNKFEYVATNINRILALVFFVLAGIQIIKII